jgi:thiol-disulfide isomerase/thioredoxin
MKASWIAFVALVALPCWTLASSKQKAADLTLTGADGARVHLRDFRGQIIVLNFWATWCGPCKAEMPLLASAAHSYQGRGVTFIGASLDEPKTQNQITDFLKRFDVNFAVWRGASGDDLARLGMGEAVPATAFLDKEGRIAARVSGQISEIELKQRIDWLLGDASTPAPKPFVQHLN